MVQNDPIATVKAELVKLRAQEEYQPYRTFLDDAVEPLVEAQHPDPNTAAMFAAAAAALLQVVKRIHDKASKGEDARELIKQVGQGQVEFNLTDLDVQGTLNQAGRDNVNTMIVQLVNQQGGKLKLPELEYTPVPIVLVVMTQDQAAELAAETVFKGYPTSVKESFRKLRRALERRDPQWIQRYQQKPEDWQLFDAPTDQTIGKLTKGLLQQLSSEQHINPPLTPHFLDISQLVQDRPTLVDLRKKGCAVVIDSISMCHPALQLKLHMSMLDAYPTTSVLHLAPFYETLDVVRKLSVVLLLRLEEMEFIQRLKDSGGYGLTEETFERARLERWLKDRALNLGSVATAINQQFNRPNG